MSDFDFYRELVPIQQFEDFTDSSNFRPLPGDWDIFITDIENSTSAIEKGLYREVNLVGAASITQAMQAMASQDIPFVFGGDGASICVPQQQADAVSEQLARLAALGKMNFGLDLRVARIPVTAIIDAGKRLLISKLEITPGKCIALFHGGGLAFADQLAKDKYDQYRIPASAEAAEQLQGLSCRWSPMPTRKGVVISLLVCAREASDMSVYGDLLNNIREILKGDIASANPVNLDSRNYKSIGKALKEESAYHLHILNYDFFKRIVDILLSVFIFKFRINPIAPFFDGLKYKNSIVEHSDYRKFDDVLRLIMDCSEQQYQKLQDCLQAAYEKRQIFYGLFASREALMTCFVENTGPGGHLHFIDGGDGGLSMASRQLKSQMSLQ